VGRLSINPRVAHTWRIEAVKKSTAPREVVEAQRKANLNSFNFFADLRGFPPLREIFWLPARFFHTFIVPCVRPAAVAHIAKSSDLCATRVQKGLLRHSNIQTTMNIYTQAVTPANRDGASKVVDNVWRK